VVVARFLGNPGMNILKGTGRRTRDGEGEVDVGVWSVPVSLEHYEGEIHLGVRPEHVGVVAPDRGLGAAEVRGVEPLGADTLIRIHVGEQPLVARVHGMSDLRPGDRVGVKLDRARLHLFDAAGARLQ
jgi:alpha-glucoside transport system ATP-binding protein